MNINFKYHAKTKMMGIIIGKRGFYEHNYPNCSPKYYNSLLASSLEELYAIVQKVQILLLLRNCTF
jgi:hypothetical protein